jgi:CO/xanthine dehydrogenase FAD-binding subunit
MRGVAASMTVLRPSSAREALKLYARTPEALPIVGGTDLMVLWNLGELNDRVMLDLSRIAEWSRIERIIPEATAKTTGTSAKTASKVTPQVAAKATTKAAAEARESATLRIGALATHSAVQRHALVLRHFPLLAEACATIGGLQIQNRGTIGGNIANASPAGDTFPPLAIYDARVVVVSASGRRAVPFLDIFAGVKKTTLGAGELIEAIELPLPAPASGRGPASGSGLGSASGAGPAQPPARRFFRKVGTRAAQAISKTVAAGALWLSADETVGDVRLALGSMAPTVRRLRTVEAALIGRRLSPEVIRSAVAHVADDVSPIDDIRSTAAYRLATSQRLLEAFLLGESS